MINNRIFCNQKWQEFGIERQIKIDTTEFKAIKIDQRIRAMSIANSNEEVYLFSPNGPLIQKVPIATYWPNYESYDYDSVLSVKIDVDDYIYRYVSGYHCMGNIML
jgi:hypothetical protein